MVKKVQQEINLINLVVKYSNEDACRAYLEGLRWPDGITCPHCGSKSISRVQKYNIYDCNSCRYQFSVTSGTIFHDTHLPLWKWFTAIYLMIESKKGISANQMKRTLGVGSYRTAWYLCHRIRAAMSNGHSALKGIIEADETFVGGKTEGMGHGYKENKAIVVGAIERGGNATLDIIDHADSETLEKFIQEHATEIQALYADELPAYKPIEKKGIKHETVNHSANEWVRGDVHTNSVENIWSLLKRSIVGSYHQVSKKHLDAYLKELEWRFNNRENPYLFRDTVLKLIKSDNLPYEKLVSN
jgi:transposase-like protein